MVFINQHHKKELIHNITIVINHNDTDTLVIAKEIDELLHKSFGDLRKKTVGEINLPQLEDSIQKNPFVAKADSYIDFRRNLHIDIQQRKPMVRIADQSGNQFYIDTEGYKMPLSHRGTPDVIIANGFIKIEKNKQNPIVTINMNEKEVLKSSTDLEKIYYLANYIKSHPFFRNQIDQIYLNNEKEFELVPKVGNHIIVLGSLDNFHEKLENLFHLYRDGFSYTGWDIYKTINLKFENQIVCTKY